MTVETQVIGLMLIFFAGAAFGAEIDEKYFETITTIAVPAISTLAAAFHGAWSAFLLQDKKNKRKEATVHIASINRTIFALARKFNKLKNFSDQFIEPVKNVAAPFLEMQPSLELQKDDIKLDLDSIDFLLETKHRDLLGDVSICIAKYQSVIGAINTRSEIHRNHVQPILEQVGVVEGGEYSLTEIRKALGDRIFGTIKNSTTDIIASTSGTLKYIEKIAGKLTIAGKDLYPKKTIINFTPIDDQKRT